MTPGHTAMNAGDFYHMPYTHSLIGTLAFAALWAIGTRVLRGSWSGAWIGAAVVASHWLLDLLVHSPDLTLLGGGRRYGFGLWNYPSIAIPLELGLAFGALAFYAAKTRARGWQGNVSIATLAIALLALQAINWLTPQPKTVIDPVPAATPITALLAYGLFAALAWWVAVTRSRAGPRVTTV